MTAKNNTSGDKYLHLVYAKKDIAKRLGAKWDSAVERWYTHRVGTERDTRSGR